MPNITPFCVTAWISSKVISFSSKTKYLSALELERYAEFALILCIIFKRYLRAIVRIFRASVLLALTKKKTHEYGVHKLHMHKPQPTTNQRTGFTKPHNNATLIYDSLCMSSATGLLQNSVGITLSSETCMRACMHAHITYKSLFMLLQIQFRGFTKDMHIHLVA